MMAYYYLDTSIWLDLFEEREEHDIHKFTIARKLVKRVRLHNDRLVYSKVIIDELKSLGYTPFELTFLFRKFRPLLLYVWQTQHHLGRAKDLSVKRNIPLFDALHDLLARTAKAILVSRDKDFQQLQDIVITKRPEDII